MQAICNWPTAFTFCTFGDKDTHKDLSLNLHMVYKLFSYTGNTHATEVWLRKNLEYSLVPYNLVSQILLDFNFPSVPATPANGKKWQEEQLRVMHWELGNQSLSPQRAMKTYWVTNLRPATFSTRSTSQNCCEDTVSKRKATCATWSSREKGHNSIYI